MMSTVGICAEKNHPGITGWFMWLWEVLHTRKVPWENLGFSHGKFPENGTEASGVCCCYGQSEIWTWCILTADWWEAWCLCLLILDKKFAGPQLACSGCAHIVRLACKHSVAICQGILDTWQPHWSSSYLTSRKQAEIGKVPKGEKKSVCGQKASEVWWLLPDCWIICTFWYIKHCNYFKGPGGWPIHCFLKAKL